MSSDHSERKTAIALNFSDVNVRRGGFYLAQPLRFPVILGNEAAGIVTTLGAGVSDVRSGDGFGGFGYLRRELQVVEPQLDRVDHVLE